MKRTAAKEIDDCAELMGGLGTRLENALTSVEDRQSDDLCKLIIRTNELALSLSQFGDRLREFRKEALAAARKAERRATPSTKRSRRAKGEHNS